MSTYLQLCKETAIECGITNGEPLAIAGQSGEIKRIIDWVARSYSEICMRHQSWRWLKREFTLNTVASDGIYEFTDATDIDLGATIARFNRWSVEDNDDPPRSYLTSGGQGTETWLIWTPYVYFKRVYRRGTQAEGAPAHISIDHDNRLVIGPIPSGIYTITGDFFRSGQVLALDADVPDMPAEFHSLIMYRAMEKYARYHSAEEILDRSIVEGRRIMRSLEFNQLPFFRTAEPLA